MKDGVRVREKERETEEQKEKERGVRNEGERKATVKRMTEKKRVV